MSKINEVLPNKGQVRALETGLVNKRKEYGDNAEKSIQSDSVIKETAPGLDSHQSANEVAEALTDNISKSPSQAVDALGAFDEERIRKLLED
mgnify:CR=1 FL=1